MGRGRPRKRNKNYPAHIDPDKLPKGIYWHNLRQLWYISFIDDTGKQRTKCVADKFARLSELHEIMELQNGIIRGTFDFIANEFTKHFEYEALAAGTRHTYDYARGVVSRHPTRKSLPLGQVPLEKWSRPSVQKLIDSITVTRGPSAAAHTHRYLRRLFRWAVNHGYAADNPALGVKPPKERKRQRLPEPQVYEAILEFARKQTSTPYLWIFMELTLHMRLRGIEALDLTDANELKQGALTNRRKRSRDTIIEWGPSLRAAWDTAKANRQATWDKKKTPVPLKPEDRILLYSARGGVPLTKPALDTAWQRMIKKAIAEGVITEEQRFSPQDIKRFSVTHTEGGWNEKREASGHKSDSMRSVYDKSIPVVKELKKDKDPENEPD